MKEYLTFDDVLIVPKFSYVKSRRDVSVSSNPARMPYMDLPIISANMDTVTGVDMCIAMAKAGGQGCLHRFWSIEDNVKAFQDGWYGRATGEHGTPPMVSIGLGEAELARADALIKAGAYLICIDVAHGAQVEVVKQFNRLAEKYGDTDIRIIVGNFASGLSVRDFRSQTLREPDAIKIGIGPGSACTTRIKTGCGYPQLAAIQDCVEHNPDMSFIADGGMKTPGDVAKALAAGADYVMLGGMLAGTNETPGEVIHKLARPWSVEMQMLSKLVDPKDIPCDGGIEKYKKYRGSASKEAYEDQGKTSSWRATEGESFSVTHKGPVEDVLKDIEGGLRSAFAYVGASTLKEFQEKATFIKVSPSTIRENGAHGKL